MGLSPNSTIVARVFRPSAERVMAAAAPLLDLAYQRQARLSGFNGVHAVISFDCDTDGDLEVVGKMHERLRAMGVQPVYAVPGELLLRGRDVYSELARDGSEFLNHGYRQHCHRDATGNYVSSWFYDQLSEETVADDVRRGHEACTAVLGREPLGFRAPHFGTYQRRRHLSFLHGLLATLGYRFSSSTMPMAGYRRGPRFAAGSGIVEVPVSGRPSAPRRTLDSWSFRFAPGRSVCEEDFATDVGRRLDGYRRRGRGLLNIYADPSQVADWPLFFDVAARIADVTLPSMSSVLEL